MNPLVFRRPIHRAPYLQGTLEPDNSRATNTGQLMS
jgi:hypothetical protein